MLIYNMFLKSLSKFPDRVVLASSNRKMLYKELDSRINMLSSGLLKLNLKPGDRVLCFLHNSFELVEIFFACAKNGISACLVQPFCRTIELSHTISIVQPKLIIIHYELYKNYLSKISNLGDIKLYIVGSENGYNNNVNKYEELLSADINSPLPTFGDDHELLILSTSGSTGRAKYIRYSNGWLAHSTASYINYFDLNHNDKCLLIRPLCGAAASIFCSMLPTICRGGEVYYVDTDTPYNTLLCSASEMLKNEKITYLVSMSSSFCDLLNFIEEKHSTLENKLRYCVVTGEKFPKLYLSKSKKCLGIEPTEVYGTSETGVIGIEIKDYSHNCLNIWYQSLIDKVIKVVDNENRFLPAYSIGEIVVTSESYNFEGYLEKYSLYDDHLGSFNTGDLGILDEKGNFQIVGRKKNIIIYKGVNILPEEIEDEINKIPEVLASCVLGLPWSTTEIPVAYVAIKSFCLMDSMSIINHLRDRIAAHKIPKFIKIIDFIPKTSTGKVDRQQLLRCSAEDFKSDVEIFNEELMV